MSQSTLTEQELHNLAMNIVGEDLKDQGYEFMAINSKLKKDPQFVVLKDKELSFVVVRAITHPDRPEVYDPVLMEKVKNHAEKFEAKTFYAGVGLGNGEDYGKPVIKNKDYTLLYHGLIEIV